MNRAWNQVSLAAILCLLAGCQSSAPPRPMVTLEPLQPFAPVNFDSQIHSGDSRYPNLFSRNSQAIWVSPEVTELKRTQAMADGETIEPELAATAQLVGAEYYLIECHMESLFPDASIAYDSVGFRAIDAYLITSDGIRVSPIQRILGNSATEEDVGTLKRYQRTNILVFAKRDALAQREAIAAGVPGVRLVLEGFNSSFYFEWTGKPLEPGEDKGSWVPTPSEAAASVRMGFSELFSKVRTLGQSFH